MAHAKDDWEKVPRKGNGYYTEAEVEIIRHGYRTGRPINDVARELKCSSRTIKERYRQYSQMGVRKGEPRQIDKSARFYTSTFEPS